MCKPNWYHSNGNCLLQCPSGTYRVWDYDGSSAFCVVCHYSCLSCKGPSDEDCITCHVDSVLTWSNGRSQCVLDSLAWRMQSTVWFYRITVLFAVNLCLMIVVVIYLVLAWYIRKRKSMYKYSKVSGDSETHADTERLQGNSVSVSDSE